MTARPASSPRAVVTSERMRPETSQLPASLKLAGARIVLREAAHPSLALLEKSGHFGSFDIDLVENVAYWTKELFRRYGVDPYGPPVTLGEAWKNIYPEDRPHLYEALQHGIESGETYSTTFRMGDAQGKPCEWMQVQAGVLRSPDGAAIRLVGVVLDITPLKAAEAAQQNAKDQVIALVESLSDAFIALDHEMRFLYANALVCERSGHSLQDLIGRTLWEVFPYTRNTEIGREYETVLQKRMPRAFETSIRLPDGELRWLDVHAYPTSDGMAAVVRDVTELKRTQEAWLASEQRFRRAQQAANIGAFEWNLESNELTWAAKVPTFTEVAESASFPEYVTMVHADDQIILQSTIGEVLTGGAQSVEVRVHPPDGRTLWFQFKAEAVFVQGRPVRVYGVAMDVTDRKQAEEALRITEKLAAAGRLAATIAHEVNNPLDAVMNLVFLARKIAAPESDLDKYLKLAESELERVSVIVRQTLGFFRSNAVPHAIDGKVLLDDVLRLFESRLNARGIAVDRQSEPTEAIMHANEGEVRQILANLTANAIDAMPTGGTLKLSLSSSGNLVCIQVGDTGQGISQEKLGRIFEPFYTTKKDHGTGLGLWASRGLAEKNGGSLEAWSVGEGQGAEFTLRLPRAWNS